VEVIKYGNFKPLGKQKKKNQIILTHTGRNVEPLENYYVNWIGDIYNGIPYERKWRDYFFWDKYTNNQYESLTTLIKILMSEMKIPKEITGHNTKINGIEMYKGIVSRSNFDVNYTDVNPSFDFDKLRNIIEI